MGAACRTAHVVADEKKEKKPIESVGRAKTIIIGVFGIENSGKTSIIKAIDGVPTDDVKSTTKENTVTITEPFVAVENRKTSSNQNRTTLRLIDVSGSKYSRDKIWEQFYDQIHGWIYVVDTTNRKSLRTSQEVLDNLYDNAKLRDKPVLFLVTKQDQRTSYDNEDDFRTDFDIDRFKQKKKIQLCTALPQKGRDRIDRSLRQGVEWLIETIEDDYVRLNSRLTKPNNQYDSESDRDVKKNSTRLPSIRAKPTIRSSRSDDDDDDDDNYRRSTKSSSNNTGGLAKRSNSAQQSLAFRASYETFPEETPWSTSKADEKFPRLTTKSSLTNSTRKQEISPLARETKWTSYGSSTKKSYGSDDDDDHRWKKPAKTRFDNDDDDDEEPRYSSKRSTRQNYDDDDDDEPSNSTRMKKVLPKSRFDQGDDDDDDDRRFYSKRSRSTRDFSD